MKGRRVPRSGANEGPPIKTRQTISLGKYFQIKIAERMRTKTWGAASTQLLACDIAGMCSSYPPPTTKHTHWLTMAMDCSTVGLQKPTSEEGRRKNYVNSKLKITTIQ